MFGNGGSRNRNYFVNNHDIFINEIGTLLHSSGHMSHIGDIKSQPQKLLSNIYVFKIKCYHRDSTYVEMLGFKIKIFEFQSLRL